jgi:hypothetical protein
VHVLIVVIITQGLISPAAAQTNSRPPTKAWTQQKRPGNAKPEIAAAEKIDAEIAKNKAAAEAREKARDVRMRRDMRAICMGC